MVSNIWPVWDYCRVMEHVILFKYCRFCEQKLSLIAQLYGYCCDHFLVTVTVCLFFLFIFLLAACTLILMKANFVLVML